MTEDGNERGRHGRANPAAARRHAVSSAGNESQPSLLRMAELQEAAQRGPMSQNAPLAAAALLLMAVSTLTVAFVMGTLVLLVEGRFLLVLLCVGSLAVAWVATIRIVGLLRSRRVARSLERDGGRDLDHAYQHGTRLKSSR